MFGALNPWLLLGALLAILASFGAGMNVGTRMAEANHSEALVEQQKLTDQETARANQIALIYGESLNTSQDVAVKLRKELNNARGKLTSCSPGNVVRFTGDFVRLHNDALQAGPADTSKPVDSPTGAGVTADELIDTGIENGRRWKGCRDQLNALIDILGGKD